MTTFHSFVPFVASAVVVSAAHARWSTDAMMNNRVSCGAGNEHDQRFAAAPGGGVWVGWGQSVPGPINFELRVQRYNARGVEQFAPGGIGGGVTSNNDVYAQRINADGSLGGPAVPPPRLGDANGDGFINFGDITANLANFGNSGPPFIPRDADGSGIVDFGDITTVPALFGGGCP